MVQYWLDDTRHLETLPNLASSSHSASIPRTPSFHSSPTFPLAFISNFNSPAPGLELDLPTAPSPLPSLGGSEYRDTAPVLVPTPGAETGARYYRVPIVPIVAGPRLGSLAHIRSLQLHRMAQPAIPTVGIFVGISGAERKGFFEPNIVIPSTSLSDIIQALRIAAGPIAAVLNGLCSNLSQVPCQIAWSRRLVELTDAYTSITTGYTDVGSLADHLDTSPVMVLPARSNSASEDTFNSYQLAANHPLYVLYISTSVSCSSFRIDSSLIRSTVP